MYYIGVLKIKARHLVRAIVKTGYIVEYICLRACFRFMLHFYDKDGLIRSGVVQAGYGRRDLLGIIEDIDNHVSELKTMRRCNLKVLML